MLKFDPGVCVQVFAPAMATAIHHASIWGVKTGRVVIVFSMNDRTHNPGSLHPFDLAIDLDVAGNNSDDLKSLYQWLRRWLDPGYDVIFENNHVHVEYDVKRPDAVAPGT